MKFHCPCCTCGSCLSALVFQMGVMRPTCWDCGALSSCPNAYPFAHLYLLLRVVIKSFCLHEGLCLYCCCLLITHLSTFVNPFSSSSVWSTSSSWYIHLDLPPYFCFHLHSLQSNLMGQRLIFFCNCNLLRLYVEDHHSCIQSLWMWHSLQLDLIQCKARIFLLNCCLCQTL